MLEATVIRYLLLVIGFRSNLYNISFVIEIVIFILSINKQRVTNNFQLSVVA